LTGPCGRTWRPSTRFVPLPYRLPPHIMHVGASSNADSALAVPRLGRSQRQDGLAAVRPACRTVGGDGHPHPQCVRAREQRSCLGRQTHGHRLDPTAGDVERARRERRHAGPGLGNASHAGEQGAERPHRYRALAAADSGGAVNLDGDGTGLAGLQRGTGNARVRPSEGETGISPAPSGAFANVPDSDPLVDTRVNVSPRRLCPSPLLLRIDVARHPPRVPLALQNERLAGAHLNPTRARHRPERGELDLVSVL
jgi:hypothetical protein